MERQVILSILRNLKVVRFEENAKYGFLGNLFYEDYVFGVYLFEDSVGQYICLEYIVNNVSDIEDLKAKIVTKYPELAKHSQDELKHLKDAELTQLNTSSIIGGRIVDYAFKVGYMDFVITARVMIVA